MSQQAPSDTPTLAVLVQAREDTQYRQAALRCEVMEICMRSRDLIRRSRVLLAEADAVLAATRAAATPTLRRL
jgi:hypothetical protein